MEEDINPAENAQNGGSEPTDGVEELTEADAAVEIDFEKDFQPSNESEGDAQADASPVEASVVADLEQQIATLKTQIEDRTNQFLRINADFENFRNRTEREKAELGDQIKSNVLTSLLEVVDNFERARAHLKPQTDGEMTIHKSYQGVYKQLVDGFKRLGVSPMRAEGQVFDPNLHEAVLREPTDAHEEGTVIEELVRGYLLGEKVLRHAMVKVAAPLENVPDADGSPEGEAAS
ncbi:MAG: nucleotide exchange factor GrpE [Cyanobacteria bacterium P01_A01_bin.114]